MGDTIRVVAGLVAWMILVRFQSVEPLSEATYDWNGVLLIPLLKGHLKSRPFGEPRTTGIYGVDPQVHTSNMLPRSMGVWRTIIRGEFTVHAESSLAQPSPWPGRSRRQRYMIASAFSFVRREVIICWLFGEKSLRCRPVNMEYSLVPLP